MRALLQFIIRNPWLYVVLAFVLLIAAWTTLIVLATGQQQPEFPLSKPAPAAPTAPANP